MAPEQLCVNIAGGLVGILLGNKATTEMFHISVCTCKCLSHTVHHSCHASIQIPPALAQEAVYSYSSTQYTSKS